MRCIVLATALLAGCARPSVHVRDVIDAARDNAIRARGAYAGTLDVTGTIVDVGVYHTEPSTVHARVNDEAPVPAELVREVREAPFLVLADPTDLAAGRLYCFFQPNKADEAATPSKGSAVTLRGRFSSIESRDHVVAVMWLCRVRAL